MAKKIPDECMFFGLELTDEQRRFRDAIYGDEHDIVFCDASAGTGKTTIAVATAKMLVSEGRYSGLYYIVSPVEEKRLGYLPGDVVSKERVYFQPLIDALLTISENPDQAVIQLCDVNSKKKCTGWINAMSHVYTRGITLKNSVVILEESQNYTVSELKKCLSRISDSCKVVVIGHHLQNDMDDKSQSGFIPYLRHFMDQERAKICKLTKNFRGWVSSHADKLTIGQ